MAKRESKLFLFLKMARVIVTYIVTVSYPLETNGCLLVPHCSAKKKEKNGDKSQTMGKRN